MAIKPKRRKPQKRKIGAKRAKRSAGKRAKPRKKRSAKKRTTVTAVRKSTTTRVRASRIGRRSPVRRHRMAGTGNGNGGSSGGGSGLKKLLPVALLVGAGLLLWKALSQKPPAVPPGAPPLIQTSNPVRNQQSSDIVQYAMAAGLAIDAITKLIQSLNMRSDYDVQNIYDELDRGGDLPATLYV